MTKQEEIREGMAKLTEDRFRIPAESAGLTWDTNFNCMLASNIMEYLHSQGVVMKIKCPDCEWSQFGDKESVGMTPCFSCNSTGYMFKPLIEE